MGLRNALLAVAFLGFATAGTAAQDVKVDFDSEADFSALKTFSIEVGTSWNNPISEKRTIAEIEEVLSEKGWTKKDADAADAIVVIHGATEQKKTLNTFYSGGGGYRWRGGGMGTSTTTASEYTVGTLVVDIFDAKLKELVFRGTALDELSDKVEKNVKKLEKATTKMFKDFPPGSKGKK